MPVTRRRFLQSAAIAVPALAAGSSRALAADRTASGNAPTDVVYPGLITRQQNPDNLEFPFATLKDWYTPNSQFYVRTHFHVPKLSAADWSLRVEGHVERPFDIGLDELRRMSQSTIPALLECAGNGRVYLEQLQPGLRWQQGGVSNAEWTGVPLAALLERANVKAGAVEVILEGHDRGNVGPSPGEIPFARSVTLAKAQDRHTLVAWQMNGEELTPAHGYPVRAVIPGWYGMASVKWLKRIVVTDRPFDGYFQTFSYTIWTRPEHGLPTLMPLTELDVKSQIARPAAYETVPAESTYRIFGAAWAGEPEITKVEISTDDGKSWQSAELDDRSEPFAWRFFHFDWRTPAAGRDVSVMARAMDASGRIQPLKRDPDRRDVMISHVVPVPVHVR